jgi:acetate---CoA ligase (ADP-forming)
LAQNLWLRTELPEKNMTDVSPLTYLLNPRSVAVIGASERPGSLGAATLANLMGADFSGKLYPVNPKYEEIFNIPCYSGWEAIPEPVDCTILCTPAHTIPALLEQAGQAGARSAIAFASGFSETGDEGRKLQEALQRTADTFDMPVCGPNGLGLANFSDGFLGFSAPLDVNVPAGTISAVCQSGSVAITLINSGRGLNYRTVISSGNEAVTTIEDYLEFLVEDPGTEIIMAFVEGFRNIPKLRVVAARAVEMNKPIIVLKIGRSVAGERAVIAHTGALAGADRVLDNLFKQIGILRVNDLDEMLETAALFEAAREPKGSRIGVMGISGGEVGLLADLAEDTGLELAQLSNTTITEIRELLPPFCNVANPLDAWGMGDLGPTYEGCLDSLARDPGVDLIAICQDSQAGLGDDQAKFYTNQANSVVSAYQKTSKPMVSFSNIGGAFHPRMQAVFQDGNVPTLQGTRESLRAIKHFVDFHQLRTSSQEPPAKTSTNTENANISALLTPGSLSEHSSSQILADYGIPITRQKLTTSLEETILAAAEIGYPVVLKIDSPDIQHKTDIRAVQIGIKDEAALSTAYTTIEANVVHANPSAHINGMLVQEMLDPEDGLELIVGMTHDPVCGPTILFGIGGIFVEVLEDIALRVAPLSKHDAWDMLTEIRSARILDGVRGGAPVDKSAIVDVLLNLSKLAVDLDGKVSELDINPLIVYPEGRGAIAADALIVGTPSTKNT